MRQKMEDHSSINYDVLALGYAYETVYACLLRYSRTLVILTSALSTHILVYPASVTVLRRLALTKGADKDLTAVRNSSD
jgi:hypothetical protein